MVYGPSVAYWFPLVVVCDRNLSIITRSQAGVLNCVVAVQAELFTESRSHIQCITGAAQRRGFEVSVHIPVGVQLARSSNYLCGGSAVAVHDGSYDSGTVESGGARGEPAKR